MTAETSTAMLTPELIATVLAEYEFVLGLPDDRDWGPRPLICRGLALAASSAVRRAWERTGSSWPIVDAIAGFLAPHAGAARAAKTRAFLQLARTTKLPDGDNDGDAELDIHGEAEEAPFGRALARIEHQAWELSAYCDDGEFIADDALYIACELAKNVSESCAREFAAVLEQLASG